MAKGKKSSKRPQAKHKPKSRSSQHDKRKRLDTPNPRRKKTVKAKVPLTGKMADLVTSMTGMLDARMAFRLSIIMAGMMLADDRRVAAAWFAAAGVQDQSHGGASQWRMDVRAERDKITQDRPVLHQNLCLGATSERAP